MVSQYIMLLSVFVWCGCIIAISFMESWLKFRAPGVTLRIGLNIGKLVFNALNKRNVTRSGFAEKLQQIIDRYNSGGASTENYFDDLMNFVSQLRDEEIRAKREGLTEEELEIFDLLKKENLAKDEEQRVKLAAKNLLQRLKGKPTVLVNDWYKDTQTKLQVDKVIGDILEQYLPESYDRIIFKNKCNTVFDHFYLQAQSGGKMAVA